MTTVRELATDAAIGIGVAKTPEGLSAIQNPGCAAAVWHRKPLESFQAWIDAQRSEDLPRARIILQPNMVQSALAEIFEASGLTACPERDMLLDDISVLAELFANMMSARYLRVRLDVVTTNACRKFHIDAVTARLVCTYRGTGTQYGISSDGAEPERVFTVATGSPIVLRGTKWPQLPESDLLHRSPPIEGTGETRLVLVLDPVFDPAQDTERTVIH
ncbi:MAG: DUF1826 domain-containing protein [Pseudomonadota bacterium]